MSTGRLVTLATCNLNQWAMDFGGNLQRIQTSLRESKRLGATYRVGPELEVPGYGCEDHFYELDTVAHSWEVLTEILKGDLTEGLVCDIGMPVIHRGAMYNCRVLLLNRKVLLIRPKLSLADDGNYRESRWFTTWKQRGLTEEHLLPGSIRELGLQNSVPFGEGVLRFDDALLAAETCEELFTPRSPHIDLALAGVEIISNGSGSHHQLRKLDTRLDLIRGATAKAGGVYLYANQRGCDGGRLYYDGCACVAFNGDLVAQGAQFGLQDVQVVVATVDLDEVVSFRGAISSLREQASSTPQPQLLPVPFNIATATCHPTLPIAAKVWLPEEEIAYGPACWLWDYLRRSNASGFLLPLSGGADSSATAAIVSAMCKLVLEAISEGDETVLADARRIGQYGSDEHVTDPTELAHRLLVTAYMGTVNSSEATRTRARTLAQQIGAYHLDFAIDTVTDSIIALFELLMGKRPRFSAHGGSGAENLALQNIQARVRMVLAFLVAQLTPWVRGRSGFLLVLGSANVDEALRGYLTKYDCSSADINPIGGISKMDLKRFLIWGAKHLGLPALADVERAPPTAELEPLLHGKKPQNDEDDMGMTYEELSVFGRLRKIARLGPVSMYRRCLTLWSQHSPTEVARKVQHFFRYYAINRHKATVLTPSYHAESYSPDDNRFDHRQFLYNVSWPWQFSHINKLVASTCTSNAAAATAATPASVSAKSSAAPRPLQTSPAAGSQPRLPSSAAAGAAPSQTAATAATAGPASSSSCGGGVSRAPTNTLSNRMPPSSTPSNTATPAPAATASTVTRRGSGTSSSAAHTSPARQAPKTGPPPSHAVGGRPAHAQPTAHMLGGTPGANMSIGDRSDHSNSATGTGRGGVTVRVPGTAAAAAGAPLVAVSAPAAVVGRAAEAAGRAAARAAAVLGGAARGAAAAAVAAAVPAGGGREGVRRESSGDHKSVMGNEAGQQQVQDAGGDEGRGGEAAASDQQAAAVSTAAVEPESASSTEVEDDKLGEMTSQLPTYPLRGLADSSFTSLAGGDEIDGTSRLGSAISEVAGRGDSTVSRHSVDSQNPFRHPAPDP